MTADPPMPAQSADPDRHVPAERLAAAALDTQDGPDRLTGDEQAHLAGCPVCRYEFDAILRVTELSEGSDQPLRALLQPTPDLWGRIAAAVATPDPAPAPAEPVATPVPVAVGVAGPTPEAPAVVRGEAPGPPRRGRAVIALVAAVIGLLVGIGGTVVVRRVTEPPSVVVSSTALEALPGETGSGTAELVRSDGALDLRVRLDATAVPDRFFQLWLIDSAGDKMYDLGTLPPVGATSYPLPAELARGLGDYTTVDISIEPYDGNPAHSHHSLVRGRLPQ